jgi:hypothetical protein
MYPMRLIRTNQSSSCLDYLARVHRICRGLKSLTRGYAAAKHIFGHCIRALVEAYKFRFRLGERKVEISALHA